MRRSAANHSPTGRSPHTKLKIAGSTPTWAQTSAAILVQAMAVKGVFSDGFQSTVLPVTAAIIAFHDQTATGKIESADNPDDAERMPLLEHAVLRPLGRDS